MSEQQIQEFSHLGGGWEPRCFTSFWQQPETLKSQTVQGPKFQKRTDPS